MDLLVASGGGHLHELLLLRDRLRPAVGSSHWVTYGTDEALDRVRGEAVTVCHHPTSRSLANAGRNLFLASRLLRELRPQRVISTGAGVAVPFLGTAARMGIEAHYVESAARVDGPSLSGRLLSGVRRVSLHSQHPGWADPRWRYGGSVFDGFRSRVTSDDTTDRPLRIAISVGTHTSPFDRLIAAVERVTGDADEVFAQLGPATTAPASWRTVARLPPDALARELAAADVVVCHAGVGLLLTSFAGGRPPVVIARRAAHGEHVDDHQQQIATASAQRGLSRSVDADRLDRRMLLDQARRTIELDTAAAPAFALRAGRPVAH